MKWKMVPAEPTPEMKRALFINLANADNEAAVIKAVMAAAPSPWVPLDPDSKGHRPPTAEDATQDRYGAVEYLCPDGFRQFGSWSAWDQFLSRGVTHWAPCQPGSTEDK